MNWMLLLSISLGTIIPAIIVLGMVVFFVQKLNSIDKKIDEIKNLLKDNKIDPL